MNDDGENYIKAAVEGAAEGLGKQLPPIYSDLLQPGLQEVGKGLANIIKLALTPISASIWGYEIIGQWLTGQLEGRLINIPPQNIITPKPSIVGPAIEAIRFLEHENELREMFAQLIANSMNAATAEMVHPGFVETLKNLTSVDAKVIQYLSGQLIFIWGIFNSYPKNEFYNYKTVFSEISDNEQIKLNQLSLLNLHRLGICNPYQEVNKSFKEDFEQLPKIREIIKEVLPKLKKKFHKETFEKVNLCSLTNYGQLFADACLKQL